MKIAELRHSAGRYGGWLINLRPKTEGRRIFGVRPEKHSRYLKQHDIWWIDNETLDSLDGIAENWQDVCRTVGHTPQRRGPPPPQPPPLQFLSHNSPYAAMHLRETAPIEVVHAVYRALAKMVHPDIIGKEAGTERMHRLNHAYEAIKAEREQERKPS